MGASHRAIEIPPDTLLRLERALKRQWQRYRAELQRCQEKLSERAIHESRVAARRLLAMLELLEGFLSPGQIKKARRCLKQHLDIFDDLRDAQVLLRAARPLQRGFPQARLFCQWLRAREGRFARQAQACVGRLRPKTVSKLVRACRDELRTAWHIAPPETAGRRLLRAVDRAFARAEQRRARIAPHRTETIHRTRVAFKKFRYMVVALAGQILPVKTEFLEALRQYQGRMGEIQDAQILLNAVEKFLQKQNIDSETGRELREQALTKRQALIESYLEIMDQMKSFWPLPETAKRGR